MTNEQLIQKFNPVNAANLTPEDLEIMHALTDEQIDVLANAYPNQPSRRAYIRLYDKNVGANKQVYNLSTWQNLRNLRKFNAKKNLIAWDFFNVAGAARQPTKATQPVAGAKSPKKVVVDMTAKEAAAELAGNVDKTKTAASKAEEKKSVKPAAAAKKPSSKVESTAEKIIVDKVAEATTEIGKTADIEFTDGQGD